MNYITYYDSPIGSLTLIATEEFLIELRFSNNKIDCSLNHDYILKDDLKIFNITKNWLDRYFNNKKPSINELNLYLNGSEFQNKVWNLLRDIPYGTVVTYKDIAKRINAKMSSQAVGGAVGKNPIGIIIPCHRVIGSNNKLIGFGGGIEVKRYLLRHEGIDIKD